MDSKLLKEVGLLVRALGGRSRPEIPWIAKVAGCSVEDATRAVNDIVAEKETIRMLCENIAGTGRSYYAQFPAPLELYALVRLSRPKTLVESGVASGVSTAFLLMGTKANGMGTLHSIDFPVQKDGPSGNQPWAVPSGMSSGWAIPSRLKKGWDLRLGRSEELLRGILGEIGRLDFYCHDSPVDLAHFEFEMKAIRKHLGPGSLVVSDNTDRAIFDKAAEAVGTKAHYRRRSSLGAFRVPGRTESQHQ